MARPTAEHTCGQSLCRFFVASVAQLDEYEHLSKILNLTEFYFRNRIEHWELSIGQIPGRIQGSGFCQVIFARALSLFKEGTIFIF